MKNFLKKKKFEYKSDCFAERRFNTFLGEIGICVDVEMDWIYIESWETQEPALLVREDYSKKAIKKWIKYLERL